MDFRFTEEQDLWRKTVHDFMDKEVGREYTREHDLSRTFPDEAYKKLADRGWLGLLVPEEYGGLAADPIMYAIFCEAIAKFSLDRALAPASTRRARRSGSTARSGSNVRVMRRRRTTAAKASLSCATRA